MHSHSVGFDGLMVGCLGGAVEPPTVLRHVASLSRGISCGVCAREWFSFIVYIMFSPCELLFHDRGSESSGLKCW